MFCLKREVVFERKDREQFKDRDALVMFWHI